MRIDGRTTTPLRRRFQAMRARAANLIPAWQEIADWFVDQERLQWGTRGARFETLWPELAESTRADKLREGWTGDILRRTRELERSLTDRPLSVENLQPSHMSVGTRHRLAKFHHKGTKRMPKRPLFDTGVIAREGVIGRAVLSWILKGRADRGGDR